MRTENGSLLKDMALIKEGLPSGGCVKRYIRAQAVVVASYIKRAQRCARSQNDSDEIVTWTTRPAQLSLDRVSRFEIFVTEGTRWLILSQI
jgi:hypothetical protein